MRFEISGSCTMASSSLRACVVAVLFESTYSLNLVNRASGKCLDLFAPCVDGSTMKDCARTPARDLREGANLQLFECQGGHNQQFEFLSNGRLRNPLTGLCIDIQAPCLDDLRTPCQRINVGDITNHANIQLWTCHRDDGLLSNSYGNQKWTFKGGELRNEGSDLCLAPKLNSTQDHTSIVDMSNVTAVTCNGKESQAFDFDLVEVRGIPEAKFQINADVGFPTAGFQRQSNVGTALAFAGAGCLIVAVAFGIRAHRSSNIPAE